MMPARVRATPNADSGIFYEISRNAAIDGNVVRGNVITRGGGRAHLVKPDLDGVALEGNIDVEPVWLNGDPLVTGDFRQAPGSPAAAYGPLPARP